MSADTSAPGILFIGSGHAARLHSKLLSKHHPQVRRAYWGRSAEPTRALVRDFGGDHCVGAWPDALSDDRTQAVFITTPPDTHRDIAVEALNARKHVIVEKPAFLTSAEFDDVEEAAACAWATSSLERRQRCQLARMV